MSQAWATPGGFLIPYYYWRKFNWIWPCVPVLMLSCSEKLALFTERKRLTQEALNRLELGTVWWDGLLVLLLNGNSFMRNPIWSARMSDPMSHPSFCLSSLMALENLSQEGSWENVNGVALSSAGSIFSLAAALCSLGITSKLLLLFSKPCKEEKMKKTNRDNILPRWKLASKHMSKEKHI